MTFQHTETTINFNQSTYTVVEDNGPLQPVLILSNPSASDILVQVESFDINATGWYIYTMQKLNLHLRKH